MSTFKCKKCGETIESNQEVEICDSCLANSIYDLAIMKMQDNTITSYEAAIASFIHIRYFKDAEEQIRICEKKIEEIKAKANANALAAEKKRKKAKKIATIMLPIITVLIIFLIVLESVIIPNGKYNDAIDLMNVGKYDEAIAIFSELGEYKESKNHIKKSRNAISEEKYQLANQLIDIEKYDDAIAIFSELGEYKDSKDQIGKCYIGKYGKDAWDKVNSIIVGETYTFGNYEQDDNKSNGKEPIDWIVLDKEGMSLFLISSKTLDCQQFNPESMNVTWETCQLRKWLNEIFLYDAFSLEEQSKIQNIKVVAEKNPEFSADPGNDTIDKVFLLNIAEVKKYFETQEVKKCVPTNYAMSQGVWGSDKYTIGDVGTCLWWLRSTGFDQFLASYVDDDGALISSGSRVNYDYIGVRPAMWITLEP